MKLGSNWVRVHALCSAHEAAGLMNSALGGQVGLESNLHPAVVERAAVRSATFRDVHGQPKDGPF
jgi:hypothetical protein